MVIALINEIKLSTSLYKDYPKINTIYFGGGTPSLLTLNEIKMLLHTVKQFYHTDDDAEVTLEANPDDINQNNLREWKAAGINRLSIGIQSFTEEDLQWMNRTHTAEQALQCIKMVRDEGFTNFSVDLIYAMPTLKNEAWKRNIETVIDLKAPHVSCYALTVESSTALQKMIQQKKKEDVDPEKQAEHFLLLMNVMKEAEYEHYEISNFALPGYRSRHNSGYWTGRPYIGIGPSAHSYFKNIRRWNVSNNALYMKSIQNNLLQFEEENLTPTQQLNEYIMTSLRTSEGLDLLLVKEKFGEDKSLTLQKESASFLENQKLDLINHKLILTTEGKLFADGIAAGLFFSPMET